MILTTAEVADLLGRSDARVRHMVREGKLTPLVPSSRPLTFSEVEVVEYELAHRKGRDRIARLAEQWRAIAS